MGASAPSARRPPAAVAPRPASPPIDRDSAPEPGPTGETRAQPALAAVPVPPSDDGSGRTALPAPAQGLPRLTLDVLVYSDVPAERLVFINGRKYVEGQVLDDGGVVEQITAEGAILRREGKQIVLRPKLNPYVRPGSP
jgi:general secretion pathway protein B